MSFEPPALDGAGSDDGSSATDLSYARLQRVPP
jgi:hypothetical protein